MNIDSVLSLAKVRSVESAQELTQAIYAGLLAHDGERQITYSTTTTDLSFDYGSGELQGLYTDLIQNEYTDEVIESKVNDKVSELTDAFSKTIADQRQISYTTEDFKNLQDQVKELIFAQVESDLSTIDEFYQLSLT